MKIVAVSDLHLETRDKIPEDFLNWSDKNDVLILAGDIGNPYESITKEFLSIMSPFFEKVFYVSGNHEYYSGYEMHKCDERIEHLCNKFDNVYYLNNKCHFFDGIKFIGSTLWSYIHDDEHFSETGDAKNIYNMKPWTKNKLFFKNVCFLTEELEKSKNLNEITVVITHHLPTYRAISKYHSEHPYNYYYASHLDHLLTSKIWIHGHSHSHFDRKIGDCLLYRNPVGYNDESWKFCDEYIEI